MHAPSKVLVVGVGGIGCPALMALARSGAADVGLCDDDVVDGTNLHRQILFRESDVGEPKIDAAARAIRRTAPAMAVHLHRTRLLPGNAVDVVSQYDVVLEGSDNFATKFLSCDACRLAEVPIVHASAVRWVGTVLAVGARGNPCYRCLFENVPEDGAPNCSEAGVMGPVVGMIAAMQVDLALSILAGAAVGGQLVTFDGRTDAVRRRAVAARRDCPLCGVDRRIFRIESNAYSSPPCEG